MTLAQKISQLPVELQKEAEDFVDFLSEKKNPAKQRKPSFIWAGALKDMKKDFTSVELQHKLSEWRSEK